MEARREGLGIRSLQDLAHRLGVPLPELRQVALARDEYYRPFSQPKKSGGSRQIHNPTGRLKDIQSRINHRLLAGLQYAPHLHGGIKGRSTITNAEPHVGQGVVVKIDIKAFFPSVGEDRIRSVWRRLLKCGEKVTPLLTELTTYKNQLPQGAPTSSALANLALFDAEATLTQELARHQIALRENHTRFVDDISFSGPAGDETKLIATVVAVLRRYGFKVSRRKIVIMRRGRRQEVCGQSVTGDTPGLPVQYLRNARAAVFKLETAPPNEQERLIPKVEGQVRRVMQFREKEGKPLLARLNAIRAKLPETSASPPIRE